MSNKPPETLQDYEKRATADIAVLIALRDKENDPAKWADLHDEIKCLAHSCFVGRILSEEAP